MMCEHKNLSQVIFIASVVAIVLSALVSLFNLALWLAGTQWALISVLLAVYAIYLKK